MLELQAQGQVTQVAPVAPPAPASPPGAPPGPAVAATPQAPGGSADLSQFSISQLREMHQELKSQRQELANRREPTAAEYEGGTGVNRDGMGERLRLLDNNIMLYEKEIVRVGQAIAARGGDAATLQDGGGSSTAGMIHEDEAGFMAFGFSAMTAVLTFFFVRRFFRKRYAGVAPGKQTNMIASNERLDRIENAVDSIAVEIERVSENQRFMTRLMTETQLGDTIKDVRKSTELARSAAENSSG
jgi:hypothetical protein